MPVIAQLLSQLTNTVKSVDNIRYTIAMDSQIIVILLVTIIASVYSQGGFGGLGGYGGGHHVEEYIDYQAPPHYHYNYAVHDPKHHDIKSHYEVRNGKETKGRYELVQPDGRRRIVEYVAGKHGIDYKVRYEGHSEHGGIGALSGGGFGGGF